MIRPTSFALIIVASLLSACTFFTVPTAPPKPPSLTGEFPVLEEKAIAGEEQAQVTLGDKYFSGSGTTQDHMRAREWYLMAAAAGDAQAQLKVALMDFHGQGTAVNLAEAKGWFEKAAEQGVPRARNALGLFAYNGWAGNQDRGKALAEFKTAARDGYGDAMFNTGAMYARGDGVAIDPVEALAWFLAAQEKGVLKSVNAVILLQAALAPDQSATAEERSKQYVSTKKR